MTYVYFSPCCISVAREHALHDFNSFKFVANCFMAQDMVYLGECSTCILLLLGSMFYICQLRSTGSLTFLLIFCLVVLSVAEKGLLGPLTF